MDELRHMFDVEIQHYWAGIGFDGAAEYCFMIVNGVPFLACSEDA